MLVHREALDYRGRRAPATSLWRNRLRSMQWFSIRGRLHDHVESELERRPA